MFDMTGMYLLLGGLFLAGLAVLAGYLLHSFALWRMARWAGIPYAWLSWLPVAKYYIQGLLCDRSVWWRTGRKWHLTVVLPLLSLLAPSIFAWFFLEELGLPPTIYYDDIYGFQQLFRLVFTVVCTAGLYHLYADYSPGSEVVFTILSLLFSFIAPGIILLTLRDRIPLSAGGTPPPPQPRGPWTTEPGQQPPYPPPPPRYDDPPVGMDRQPLDQDTHYPPRR